MPGITESFLSTLSEEERDKFCLNILKINAPEFFGNMNLEEYKHIREKTTEEEIFRMIAEADAENTGKITYTQFKRVIAEQKKNQSLSNEEDTLDAFVSMGG